MKTISTDHSGNKTASPALFKCINKVCFQKKKKKWAILSIGKYHTIKIFEAEIFETFYKSLQNCKTRLDFLPGFNNFNNTVCKSYQQLTKVVASKERDKENL